MQINLDKNITVELTPKALRTILKALDTEVRINGMDAANDCVEVNKLIASAVTQANSASSEGVTPTGVPIPPVAQKRK